VKKYSAILALCLCASSLQAAPDITRDPDFAAAGLRLCIAVHLERLDDGEIPPKEIVDAVLRACDDEIATLARLTPTVEGNQHPLLHEEVRRTIIDQLQMSRGGEEL
jgi:hypothetical protein